MSTSSNADKFTDRAPDSSKRVCSVRFMSIVLHREMPKEISMFRALHGIDLCCINEQGVYERARVVAFSEHVLDDVIHELVGYNSVSM